MTKLEILTVIIFIAVIGKSIWLLTRDYQKQRRVYKASWYYKAGTCADGSKFTNDFTCATWLFPLGTHLMITNIGNKKVVFVKVTDRTARKYSTRIDLSKKAFSRIGSLKKGVIFVNAKVYKFGNL